MNAESHERSASAALDAIRRIVRSRPRLTEGQVRAIELYCEIARLDVSGLACLARGGARTRKRHLSESERNERRRNRYLEEMEENPEDPRHGTLTGYAYGCRCERCVAAKRQRYLAVEKPLRKKRRLDGLRWRSE